MAAQAFQPTRPVRGATRERSRRRRRDRSFNPRAPCGARPDDGLHQLHHRSGFNPRAPCGARRGFRRGRRHQLRVSTHAPRAGRDMVSIGPSNSHDKFQPTRPVRGATPVPSPPAPAKVRFNPRAPCGARRWSARHEPESLPVSTHAPRAGRDLIARRHLHRNTGFNPRAPCGARHAGRRGHAGRQIVSTHAPRAGRDDDLTELRGALHDVSTHAPRAGRDITKSVPASAIACVSTHAPRAGRDSTKKTPRLNSRSFNPRAPCGARPCLEIAPIKPPCFNPRAPCGARRRQCTLAF